MSDMHTLTGGTNGEWTVVMHFAVPNSVNAVGVNYRTALLRSGIGGMTQMTVGTDEVGRILAEEKTAIEVGQVYEHMAGFVVESGGSTASQLKATLEEFYESEQITVIKNLKKCLRYYGHVENLA